MRVSANSDQCDAVTDIPVAVTGEMEEGAKEIAFNGAFLDEALKASLDYAGEVNLLLNKQVSPMAILPIGRDDYYQLALPVT